MSRVYFHSYDNQDVAVLGSERAYFDWICKQMTLSILNADDRMEKMKKMIDPRSYLHQYENAIEFQRAFDVWFSVGWDHGLTLEAPILPNVLHVQPFELSLNTAYAIGNDPIKLAARIHGQCEIHCYVEGPNRQWLSDIINQGLKQKIYRESSGWDLVMTLLEKDASKPVVLSYSVTDRFPNRGVANYVDDRDGDGWHELSNEEQWERAMKGLRDSNKTKELELTPENWTNFHFTNGVTAFQLIYYMSYM